MWIVVRIPDDYADVMDKKGFAHMATIGPKGEPHSSPVWYDWDGEHVLVSHTKERQKFANIQRDPRVALSILDPDDPYRMVEIRGSVEIVEDPEKTLINKLARKYEGKDSFNDAPGNSRVIFKITPERVLTH